MGADTLCAMLQARAKAMPGKTAVQASDGQSHLSYAELHRRANGIAASLARHGCRPGETIIVGLGSSPAFFAVLFGCFRAGLTAVPVDTRLTDEELQGITGHADPAMIITDHGAEATFRRAVPDRRRWTYARHETRAAEQPAAPVTSEDAALLLYTSGTTGHPKAVRYTHATLVSRLDALRRWFGLNDSYTSLCLLPTHFGHGLICNCLLTFAYSGTLVIAPPFNMALLQKLWSIVDDYQINTFSSVPAVVRLLLEYSRHRGTPPAPASLRFVTCASAPLRPEEIEAFEGRFNVPLLNCYGLTETAGWSACSPRQGETAPGSVGMAVDCEIRAVDSTGKPLPAGHRGELQIRGPGVMRGYYRYSGRGGDVVDADGWLSTGDIGEIDAAGTVFIHSRIKELIIRAGRNIYPPEIDGVLMSHPDVIEACALGLHDSLMGEQVAACVVRGEQSSLSEDGLIAYAREHLVDYKCPQQILFLEKIPKTGRGKINRAGLSTLFTG